MRQSASTLPENKLFRKRGSVMQPRRCLSLALIVGLMAVGSATAFAQLPTCAQLNTDPAYGLVGNPVVIEKSSTLVPPAGANPAYCRVDFVVSERGGTAFGYAAGEIQRVGLRVGLPANTADGGSGGGPDGQGAWNGKVRNLGGGGLVGAVGGVTAATNARYVGSSTDSGHTGNDPSFGVIQATHELNLGKIEDFFSESLRLQYQWALRLAQSYYGKPAVRNYWDGCSTGGRQGLVLAWKFGADFDGFLIGAPHTNHVQNSVGGSFRQWANKDIAGGSVTDAKFAATVDRLVNACDALDGVTDGLLNEPRMCKASAALNICGQPGSASAPDCLTATEASVIDIVMDGPRNDLGHRVWFSSGRATDLSLALPANGQGGNGVFAWANKDLNFDWRTGPRSNWDDLVQQATNTFADYINMSSPDLSLAKNHGAKILMWHGLADNQITFQSNIYYYSKVLDYYQGADNVTPWFRFFLAPGVAHCGGGVGPQPQNLFNTLVNWAENAVAPDSILSSGGGRTRPLCPFPQTAIYDGVGNPNLASSFSCGGNIQTKEAKCDGLIAKFKHEAGAAFEPLGGEDDLSCGLAFSPITFAALSPSPVNGWYRNPTVTLSATDQDMDLDHVEYLVDSTVAWTTYVGPFQVTGDGQHMLQYRSVDKVGHVESVQSLAFKIDATAPLISGLPVECTIWPPNDKLVRVAEVSATDNVSGVAPGSLSLSVVSNEPVAASDIVIEGGTVQVRAQRSRGGTGRVYTINTQASDIAGNTANATTACTVPHDQGK
jgi:feruloyl esterase